MTGRRERAKAAVAINKARMTTRVSEAKRDEESKNRLMMQKKKKTSSQRTFGSSEVGARRSAGKGRRTTLVSEHVSSSRSFHFSGSHRPPPLHHWRGG